MPASMLRAEKGRMMVNGVSPKEKKGFLGRTGKTAGELSRYSPLGIIWFEVLL